MLGVGVFFTLSGYLITDLLLGHWQLAREIRLGDFWLRRARRLLPALYVVPAAFTGWAVTHRAQLPALRGAVTAALGYVSNWCAGECVPRGQQPPVPLRGALAVS